MAQTIKLKRSAQSGASGIPSTSDLALGEVGINTYHGKMYIKKDDGTESIVEVGGLPLSGGTLTGNLNLGDGVSANFGASNDLQIYHDGSASYISDVGTGNLRIKSNGVATQILDGSSLNLAVFNSGNGQAQLYNVNSGTSTIRLATTSTGIDVTGEITADGLALGDSQKATFGASDDLQIYHDVANGNSVISEHGSGSLKIQGADVELSNLGGFKWLKGYTGDRLELFYNNAIKLATTSTGIDVTGVITTDGMTTSADINFGDDDKALFGASNDLKIYHSANNQSYIHEANADGSLFILGTHIYLQNSSGQDALNLINGDAYIKSGGQTKLQTTSTGISISNDANFPDNGKAIFGAGDDLEIFSNGSTALLKAGNATSDIRIESDNRIVIADRGFNEAFAVFNDDSDVKLYHDGNQKLATTATGADITGVLTADGLTVDGNVKIDGSDELRYRIFNSGTFKAGLEVATTAGDMIDESQVGDFAIRSQGNLLFSANGNAQRLKINSSGIDVTGSVVADGLTVEGATTPVIRLESETSFLNVNTAGKIEFYTNDASTNATGVGAEIVADSVSTLA